MKTKASLFPPYSCSRLPNRLACLLLVLAMGISGWACYAAEQYTLTDLGAYQSMLPYDLNDSDQVVGRFIVYDNTGNGLDHAFLWENGRLRDIMGGSGVGAAARAINNSGQVLIQYSTSSGPNTLVWRDGTSTRVGGSLTMGWRMNNGGQVTGTDGSGGFRWDNGRLQYLSPFSGDEKSEAYGINDLGDCVGISVKPDWSWRAMLWRASGEAIDLGSRNEAYAVNNRGQVVGGWFLWDNGTLNSLDGMAYDINDQGLIVGQYGNGIGALWENGTRYNLNDLVVNLNGAKIGAAMSINEKGHIATSGTLNGEAHAFLLTPVSQPPIAACKNITVPADPGQCHATVSPPAVDGGSYDPDGDSFTFSLSPPGPFPPGRTTVTLTVTDTGGLSNTCQATITVVDKEAPVVACRPRTNPAGHNIPSATQNGKNHHGFYQLVAQDNCDRNPKLFVGDSESSFVAGPFRSGQLVTITQAPKGRSPRKKVAGAVIAHISVKGAALVYAVDSSQNTSAPVRVPLRPRHHALVEFPWQPAKNGSFVAAMKEGGKL